MSNNYNALLMLFCQVKDDVFINLTHLPTNVFLVFTFSVLDTRCQIRGLTTVIGKCQLEILLLHTNTGPVPVLLPQGATTVW